MKPSLISTISGLSYPIAEHVDGMAIPKSITELICIDHPDYDGQGLISLGELNNYREQYITQTIERQVKELGKLEKTVVDKIGKGNRLTKKRLRNHKEKLTYAQLLAHKVDTFGGSWNFIIIFGVVIFCWIVLNVLFLTTKAFDPYPFNLLNLILSCLAAIQAPIIMMNQNRQEVKDRAQAEQDYIINLKSELEIQTLHEKLDHLIIRQQSDLFDIQQVQIQMLKDILNSINNQLATK